MANVFRVGPDTATFTVDVTGDAVSLQLDGITVLGEQATAQANTAAATATAIAAAVPSAVATTGVTQTTPFGYAGAAQGDAVATTINSIITHITEVDLDYEALLVDVNALRVTVNALLAKLRTHGIIAT